MVPQPMNPQSAAVLPQLGGPLKAHPSGRWPWLFFSLGMLFLFFALVWLSAALSGNDTGAAYAAMIIALGLAGWMFYLWWRGRKNQVVIHQGGLLITQGSSVRAVRWEDINSVRQHIMTYRVNFVPVVSIHNYRLRLADGSEVRLDRSVKDIKSLGATVHQETASRLLPRARASMQQGYPVTFKGLQVTPNGLQKGNDFLPWSEFNGYNIANGNLRLMKKDKRLAWKSIPINGMDNPYVLINLLP